MAIDSKKNPSESFWRGKKVLVTGHTGFKGGWLVLWLKKLGANVCGIALAPNSSPSLFSAANISENTISYFQDIKDLKKIIQIMSEFKPEIVFHLAAQPLVRESYKNPVETFSTNVQGTANLLESLRSQLSVKVALIITTDKVYFDEGNNSPHQEMDRLGGRDPYSASKAAAEIVTECYVHSYLKQLGIALATARAGNVIGGGDWSIDRLIPDAMRAWTEKKELVIRKPEAIRPWQHVLEPISAYLIMAEVLALNTNLSGSYNIGPPLKENRSVFEVINAARLRFGEGDITYLSQNTGVYETASLILNSEKANKTFGLKQRWNLNITIEKTIDWYKKYYDGVDAQKLCLADIEEFETKSVVQNIMKNEI